MDIKAGDIVRVKSGGPWMTVSRVQGDDVYCVWFPDNSDAAHRTFNKNVLVKEN